MPVTELVAKLSFEVRPIKPFAVTSEPKFPIEIPMMHYFRHETK
jgi:hypothetical protein